jgi:predicted Zn finger-like uncharacterized protein
MIVSCPQCAARYRVPEERISERGARITCPACRHRFTVHSGEQRLVVGGEAEPRGLNVLGHQRRPAGYDEEDDQPTTVMTAAERDALAREAGVGLPSRPPLPVPPPPPAPVAGPVASPAGQRTTAPKAAPKASKGPTGSSLLVIGAVLAALIAAAFLLT